MTLRSCLAILAVAGAAVASPLVPPLAAQSVELVGTLHSVWRDPLRRGELPRLEHSLHTDDGRSVAVVLTPELIASRGGDRELAGARVRLAVDGGRVTAIRAVESKGTLARPFVFTGTPESRRYVTLLCRFPDFPDVSPGTVADAERAFGAAYPGTAHYWGEVSDGRITMTEGIVRGWYTMPAGRDTYVGSSDANVTTLARDCAAAADADVDFSTFSGVNFVFNTDIGCCYWGGTGSLTLDGGPRAYGMTWLGGGALQQVGSAAHEIGHAFGLQHSSGPYGLVYDSHWDIMSASAWYAVPGGPLRTGAHVNAYGKLRLGFIPAERDRLLEPGTHEILLERTVTPAENGNLLVARINAPRFLPAQYYTLEARGVGGYDAPLPGAGIVIHRIGGGGASPSNVVDPDGDFDPSDAGAVIQVGERFDDPVNGITVRVLERVGDAFRVSVVVADYPRVSASVASRTLSVVAGEGGSLVDSALVTLGGVGAGTAWSARSISPGPLQLRTSSGASGEPVRWALETAGLAPGQYYQEIRVELPGAAPARIEVRLSVTVPAALVASVALPAARDSVIAGAERTGWNSVVPAGPGATTATWAASTSTPWIAIDSVSGTGRGTLAYRRNSAGLALGMHVGTIDVDVAGAVPSRVTIIDSLLVMEPPTITVAPRIVTRATMPQGGYPVLDSLYVGLSGRWATGASWFAYQSAGGSYVVPQPAPRGSGWLRFTRSPGLLAPGTYPAEVTIALQYDSQALQVIVRDTLVVTAAPPSIVLSSSGRRTAVRGASTFSEDSLVVHPAGPSNTTRTWEATAPPTRLAFPLRGGAIPNRGTGTGSIRWIRNLEARPLGWSIDTITFAFVDGPGTAARFVDSVYVESSAPTALAISAASRRTELLVGSTFALADSVDLLITGADALATAWSASASSPAITFALAAGQGPARLRWTRDPSGLAVGWHVDTIRVSAAALGSPREYLDSLRVYAPLTIPADGAQPQAVMGADYARLLTTQGGPTAPVRWRLVAGALPTGVALDTTTGAIAGVPAASGLFEYVVRAVAGSDTTARTLQLNVTEPALDQSAVVDQVLGGPSLTPDQRRYLDLQGNRNGRVDIGDIRAWRTRQLMAAARADSASVRADPAPPNRAAKP